MNNKCPASTVFTTLASTPSQTPCPTLPPVTTTTTATTTTATTTTAGSTTTTAPPKINYRLPGDLKPYFYDISLSFKYVNEEVQEQFDGTSTISFECKKTTNKVVLHIKNLDIKNHTIKVVDNANPSFNFTDIPWEHDEEREFFTALLPANLQASRNYTITIGYVGYLLQDNVGFYKSSYTNANGEKRFLAYFFNFNVF